MNATLLKLQFELSGERRPYALATVVEVMGSSSAKAASKAIFDSKGRMLAGWMGGGCAQAMVGETALNCLLTGETRMIEVDLTDEVFGAGMPCGGRMRVFVEPIHPNPLLWLAGHGRIAEALCAFAFALGFDVFVHDARADPEVFPDASRIVGDDGRFLRFSPEAGDFVVIASHHKGDYESLSRALHSDARYIALVASRHRSRLVLERLASEGFAAENLARVRAPAGLDLGAKLPEEIGLAIAAEMVMVRRGGSGGPLSGPR